MAWRNLRMQARYLSMDKAIFASAVVFAAAHSSLERLLPLTLLVRTTCRLCIAVTAPSSEASSERNFPLTLDDSRSCRGL